MKRKNINGYIIYEGESMIDGSPIVAVVTGFHHASNNPKTGTALQTWIIPSDIKPSHAAKLGKDSGCCGNCPLKPSNNGSCYVNLMGVNKIYLAYLRGNYPQLPKDCNNLDIQGKALRLGSYGEPVAVPLSAWLPLIELCRGTVGYTHQWHKPKFKHWSKYLMASVENIQSAIKAQSLGYRTYRVTTDVSTIQDNEIMCLNQVSGIQCKDCRLCDGNSNNNITNVIAEVHGLSYRVNNFKKLHQN